MEGLHPAEGFWALPVSGLCLCLETTCSLRRGARSRMRLLQSPRAEEPEPLTLSAKAVPSIQKAPVQCSRSGVSKLHGSKSDASHSAQV